MRLRGAIPIYVALASMLASALPTCAQTIGSNAHPGQTHIFKMQVKSQLVVENVTVLDKQGKFVSGLTAKDFKITEDGTPQTIRIFKHQVLSSASTPLPVTPRNEEHVILYKRLVPVQIAAENPNRSQYSDHRLLVFYFDMTAMPPDDQQRALDAAKKFVRTRMTADDLVAIMWYTGGAVQVVQDFTANRDRLLSILETMMVGQGQGSTDSVDDASSADTQVAFGQDNSEFNIFNNDRQLSALQTAVDMLSGIKEAKSLIYFASGLHMSGLDNIAQLHATIDSAIRDGVSFWPIDARGLVAEAPLGDATKGSPGNIGMYSGAAAQAETSNFEKSQDTMYTLGADTGGKALFDNNDLTQGILRAQHAIGNYYILGYYTTNTVQNGHYRRVKITVDSPLAHKLDYRHGYFAGKTFQHFNQADKERQLEDAMMLGDPITQLTIAMEVDYFQLNRAQYFVPVTINIPGRELALAKHFGADHTVIDFLCEVKDAETGATMSNLRDHVDIKLSDETAAQLTRRRVEYDTGFTLFPGRYLIKFLARDDETGRIGTFQTYFSIPNLNAVKHRVAISSVVLGSQRVDVGSALYNVVHGKKQAKNNAADPLVQDGSKLIPSVTRTFNRGQKLYVYLQAYQKDPPPAYGAKPVSASNSKSSSGYFAFVSLYQNQKLAYESAPVAVKVKAGTRLGVIPVNFQIGLASLDPGKYRCEVTVLDAGGQRAAFWQGPFLLLK
jgi:VWFA-related protein